MSLSTHGNKERFPRKILARYDWSFNARQRKDTDKCAIVAMVCLPDGRTVILDHCNNALKVFDQACQITFQTEVDENSYGIAHLLDTIIAMTCGRNICFFDIKQDHVTSSSTPRIVELDQHAYAISCERNHIAASFGHDDRFIRILDIKGKTVSVMESREIFGKPLRIGDFFRLDPVEDRLFISDGENKRVVCMSFIGDALWVINLNGYPGDLLVMAAYILVVLPDDNEIWITSKKESKSELYISKTDGLLDPNLLSYQERSKMLFVSHMRLQDDVDAFKAYPRLFE